MIERTDLLNNIRETLIAAGFYVSEPCSMRPMGFDLVARGGDALLIIKVLTNIDALSEDVAKELQILSNILKGHALLIGEKSGAGQLQDNVVYFRFGIQTVTPKTLKNHFLEDMSITVYSAPGGLYVNLDAEKIRLIRKKQSISLGSFARFVKVSRRTARMYEEGMDARYETTLRMEKFFGESVITPMDLLHSSPDDEVLELFERTIDDLRIFQKNVLTMLEDIGYSITPFWKCPFEALSRGKNTLLLTCVHRFNKTLVKKARFVNSISKIMDKHAVLFTDKETVKRNVEGVPLIFRKELEKVSDPEKILDLITERA